MTEDRGRELGAPAAGHAGFRPDIEGLRAIAVGSVLLYHAGLAWIPGGFAGVDIFFVISGFLITSLMVREVERSGRLRLGAFWARRARRLLPASTLVLAFSALVTLLWLPVAERKAFGGDIVAAAGYVVNWRLGYREVDYLAEDVGASPVQHYWSLAVEEQFYVVWPLVMALVVVLVASRLRRRALFLVALVATVASFAWSLHYSDAWPGLAFFVSTTRAWELGVGALLAIAAPYLARRLPAAARALLGVLGLAAIVTVMLAYDTSWAWPSTGTLLPVLGAAALILAGGDTGRGAGVTWLLGIRPAVWVGALSYSLYLWHWPLLVAAEGIWGDDLRVRHTLLVVLFSVVPAWLSYRYVENPIRTSGAWAPTGRALWLGLGTTLVSIGTGIAVIVSFGWVDTARLASADEAPGAVVLLDRSDTTDWAGVESVDAMRPSPLDTDEPPVYDTRECIPEPFDLRNSSCEFGDLDSDRTVVLVGDSKAAQWFSPVEQIAEESGWRMVFIAKGACEFADVVRPIDGQANEACDDWSQWALDEVLAEDPDVVVTVTRWGQALRPGDDLSTGQTREAMVDGLVAHWNAVIDDGALLVPLIDTPGPRGGKMPECVQEHLEQLTDCVYRLDEVLDLSGAPAQRAALEQVPQARPIDLTEFVCPDGVLCPPVIGNVLVYRSGTHLSDTYATTLAPVLSDRLFAVTEGALGEPLEP
ncbi:acyltransferase family protein [Nocardioides caeni]|uniref:Acyltransferase n=1 Tax=Nocardioides caeni TaxID=574700 RepID=A0A4S8NUP7_9ACTN|nr:acyltransferase family protein [Nocardioides caeni]THV18714.1 acyltransferase [Nocardioides caeni]